MARCRWWLAAALWVTTVGAADEPWMALIGPSNSFEFTFLRQGKSVASLGAVGWGPGWAWRGFSARQRGKGGVLEASGPFEVDKAKGQVIDVALRVWQSGPRAVSYRYTLTAQQDVPCAMFVATVNTDKDFRAGEVVTTQTTGKTSKLPLSLGLITGLSATSELAFKTQAAGEYTLKLDPPRGLAVDNGLRVLLAEKVFPKGTETTTLTFTFPENVSLLVGDDDVGRFVKPVAGPDWYPVQAKGELGPTALGFEDWLEKPAGKRGQPRLQGERFVLGDGTPIKFWGTNLSYALSAPNKQDAEQTAARFAKWGVNAVRMHKFTGPSGWEGIGDKHDVTKMDPAGLERLDYFAAQLARHGVYYGWSHTFGMKVQPGNKDRLLAYDEIVQQFKGNTYGLINLAEDVQDLMIEMVVGLLKHTNPQTGKTYAEDPALCFIELQNEDDIFFYTNDRAVNACPTYKQRFITRWSEWLKQRYGTTERLRAAWPGALAANETLEAKNIALQANPWFFGSDHLPNQKGGARRRLLDNAAWYHEVQNRFYSRFVKAIRDAGYQGPLCGSPWQAPAMLPHYYNLRSDQLVGYIDRHNYFGGKLGDTMLGAPGSGYFSTGLQQVAGRPFGISEWIHVYPSLYSAEGPAILAAYGLGLQDWDCSYEFQSHLGRSPFGQIVGNFPWGVWNADTPTQLGQYPVLARMVARGDVRPGDVVATRRVCPDELADGTFNFTDKVTQQGDIKSFTGSTPAESLAIGRCLVEFGDEAKPSTFADVSRWRQGKVLTSTTGQLRWDASERGWFTVDTPGTQAVVGFAEGRECALADVTLKLECPYASLFVTAAERDADLKRAGRVLVSALARNCNTGFTTFTTDQRVIDNGKGPILLEPVKASIKFPGRTVAAVNVLDHDGKATGRTVAVTANSFTIDGAADKTPFYEVVLR